MYSNHEWDMRTPVEGSNSDPRGLAAIDAMRYRQTPEGHLDTVANSTWMAAKQQPQVVYEA
ncbi:MAG TPA: hypothetical protein VMR77_01970 [Patescibacteria group bacterium]|nr:hypothetical protein [Patescibacteria group bacterium]